MDIYEELKAMAEAFDPDEFGLPEDFRLDPELYYDVFDIAANIQVRILAMLEEHVERIIRQQLKTRNPKT